jgi:hypothetical protein
LLYALEEKVPGPEAFLYPTAVLNPGKVYLYVLQEHALPAWIFRIAAGRLVLSRDYWPEIVEVPEILAAQYIFAYCHL